MKDRIPIAFLLLIAILSGCSPSEPGTTGKLDPEVKEISLITGGEVTYTTGSGRSDVVTFRRDGTAEMRSEATKNFAQQAAVVKRARLTTDQFEQLAKVIKENGFFDKNENEGHVEDAWRNLKVVTTAGEKTVQTLGRDDDGNVRAMIDAVNALARKLSWEEVK